MDELHNQVFSPGSLPELFSSWSRFPDAVLFAGGTELVRGQGGLVFRLPRNLIALGRIEELRRFSRTERFLDIGATATLSEILALGKILPEALRRAIAETANPQVRNLATIGGNICCPSRRMDTFAPLVALDARLELRTAVSSRWISASRFAPAFGPPLLGANELLTRIRLPLETWDYCVHRRLGTSRWPDDEGAVFSFIARAQKGILSDVRMAFAGKTLVRDREIDNAIIGKSLPLEARMATAFVDRWRTAVAEAQFPSGLLKDRFLNLVEQAVFGLCD